ncbi:cupin domain-containing protein [Naumannella halotolerans]|uniref:(S)-ureidoglycine aminohydrolase cupin domain-containing protein n=1 Tax=Naumannella halotolerans TaxID=993414 RepID=A0A4R7J7L4_9ACTN|nr:cupin domain-containing protein [Naumannella halotolerans]TDT33442.1 hypothetical protein CLV29_1056 [Naumannella halotolerans]
MSELAAGQGVDASDVALQHTAVEDWQRVTGDPTTASAPLGSLGELEIGLWEMSGGTMRDVEADEFFVVLTGAGVIDFDDPGLPPLQIGPGSVVRLADGMHTTWTITDGPLRKLYLT